MSAIIQGSQLRTLLFGDQVVKSKLALPQDTTAGLFVVSSGNVLVTSLIGQVTTAIQNQTCTLSLGLTPLTGTAENAGIATAGTITALEAGTYLTPGTTAGGALVGPAGHAGNAVDTCTPFVVPAGTITATTSANNTGNITWYLTYVPLDNGAAVS